VQAVHPYSAVPDIGAVLEARATAVTPAAVQLDDGQQVAYDYLILAPGSSYPEPAIKAFSGSLADRKAAIKVRQPAPLIQYLCMRPRQSQSTAVWSLAAKY
jgi:NADPH-dependent 2,4-dienoyl-CoA reductase/sulfur reductase-like enzyme